MVDATRSQMMSSGNLLRLLQVAAELVRSGYPREALDQINSLSADLTATQDAECLGFAEHLRASCHQNLGDHSLAMVAGYRAIAIFENLHLGWRLQRSLSLQATILSDAGDSLGALELLDRALHSLPGLADAPREQCVYWCNASLVYGQIGRVDDAVHACERALVLCTQHDELPLTAMCKMNLATAQVEQAAKSNDGTVLEVAIERLRHQIDLQRLEGRPHLVCSGAVVLVDTLVALDRLADVRRMLEDLYQELRLELAGPDLCKLMVRLAQVERLTGNVPAATAYLAQVRACAESSPDVDLRSRVLSERSALHEFAGDYKLALQVHKQFMQLQTDSLRARSDSRTQAMAMRNNIEQERMQAQLLLLRNAQLENDMTRMSSEASDLRRMVVEDPLTGLGNRRGFDQYIHKVQVRAGLPLMILMADIDFFKSINDTHSHVIGDRVLQQVGELLRSHCRPEDFVARFGGEEFVIAFGKGLTLDGARSAAERLRFGIEQHDWSLIAPGLTVTASFGLACGSVDDVPGTVARADAALYRSKSDGRNRLTVDTKFNPR